MNKNVLVTGSSKGIGAAIATVLANSDYNVFLTARNADELNKIYRQLKNLSSMSSKMQHVVSIMILIINIGILTESIKLVKKS